MPDASTLVAPAFEWMPDYRDTLGPEVAEVAELAGFTPDPEQRMALDWTFAFGDNGKAAVRDFGICAPRQNLKTGYLKMCALGWLYITEQRLTVWSAHEFGTAQESFRDMCQLIEDCPDLDAEVKQIHRGNGDEAIELRGNRRLRFKARTKSGGRGLTGNKVVLDEAMFLTPTHMGALVPTLRAVPDPQLVLAGSAGMVSAAVWRGYRDRGRAGGDPRLGWLEWADPDPNGCEAEHCDHALHRRGCALDDRARWWACNTALGRRITEDTLEADRRNMDPAEFARETLGWWEDPPTGGGVLDLEAWAMLGIGVRQMRKAALAVEVALDRSQTTIGTAWRRAQGVPHVEIVEERPGTGWVVDRLTELAFKYQSPVVVLDGQSEAAGFAADLEAAGVPVHVATAADRLAACGAFYDAATNPGNLTHSGDPAMAAAIAAAQWKDVGDGGRVFARRKSAASIAPLYAVTYALHGLLTAAEGDGYVI